MGRKLIFLLLFLGGGGLIIYSKVRGLRNNNPGNIKRSRDSWVGLSPYQSDETFFQFISPEYGLRAIMVILGNYYTRYGLNTVRGLITRWSATDQEQYVGFVSDQLGVKPDDPIDVKGRRIELARAITRFENGIDPYSATLYKNALEMV